LLLDQFTLISLAGCTGIANGKADEFAGSGT
jgi:hypothetical protein